MYSNSGVLGRVSSVDSDEVSKVFQAWAACSELIRYASMNSLSGLVCWPMSAMTLS